MKYLINPIRSFAVLLLFTASIGFSTSCSSKISNASDVDAGEGGGGFCGDGICQFDEDDFSCPEDCASTARCGDTCGADGQIHYCDENGNDASFACPESLGSTCVLDSLGFPACSCGTISSLGTCYEDNSIGVDLVQCESGIAQLYYCLEGAFCDDDGSGGAGCFCDNLSDGICPDASCTSDPDCSQCTPNCNGNVCGSNGCGGDCGSCSPSQTCQSGSCESSCTPSCGGKECGSDGCSGSCGSCDSGESCQSGSCVGAPSGNSISYTVSGSLDANVSGIDDGGDNIISCQYSEVNNTISLFTIIGDAGNAQVDYVLEIEIAFDPIGFCFFATFPFQEFSLTEQVNGQGMPYTLDNGGDSSTATLSCDVTSSHFSATFSADKLYPSGNIVFDNFVNITNGTIECDL